MRTEVQSFPIPFPVFLSGLRFLLLNQAATRAVSTRPITRGQIGSSNLIFFIKSCDRFTKNTTDFFISFMVIMMCFLPLVFLAATFVAPAISDDLLFSDNSPDLSTFQDTPQDLLALQSLPEASTLTGGDENLFSDPDSIDLSSSTEAVDLYLDLKASCLPNDGQSLNKVRPRDEGPVCTSEGSTPESIQRIREAWGAIEKWRDGLWNTQGPSEPEPEKQPPSIPPPIDPEQPEDSRCPSDFPIHFCCGQRGKLDNSKPPISMLGNNPLRSYFFCSNGL